MKYLPSVIPANEARTNFYQMVEEAGVNMRQFTIVRRNGNPVIMMSVAEFEGLQETLEVVANKSLMASIKRAQKSKKIYTEAEAKKILKW